MRSYRTLFLLAAILPAARAQETTTLALSNGARLTIQAAPNKPGATETLRATLSRASGNSFYRIFRDQNNLAVYGYELAIDRPGDDAAFTLTLRPAVRLPLSDDGGKPVPSLSAEKVLPTLHSGDHTTVNFFDMPGTGATAADTYELQISPNGSFAGPGESLHLADLKVYLNRNLIPGPPTIPVAGRFAMFYVPSHGAYYLSAGPVDGAPFVEAGFIDRTRLQFQVENEVFDATTSEPILAQQDHANLWVYHDPSYAPIGNWTLPFNANPSQTPGYFVSASDTLGWWLASPAHP